MRLFAFLRAPVPWAAARLPVICTLVALAALVLLSTPTALAQGQCSAGDPYYWAGVAGSLPQPNNCFGSSGFRCYAAEQDGATYFRLKDPACDPTAAPCTVQLRVPLRLPGVEDMVAEDGLFGSPTPVIYWFSQSPAPPCTGGTSCGQESICGTISFNGKLNQDRLETWVEAAASCSDYETRTQLYSLRVLVCDSACESTFPVDGLTFADPRLPEDIGCPPEPPPEECNGDSGCLTCPAPGSGIGGGGPGAGGPGGPATGPGATLRYSAGGAGHPGLPGSTAWNLSLGRYWSHEYAQRIVEAPLAPADPPDSHVWMITQYGTFREFGDLVGGKYQTLAPSDEYRTLYRTGVGWELHDLDGTVTAFDNGGLWVSTTDRNSNAKIATYSGTVLDSVAFPDGRREDFGYHPDGKLASITEVGVDGLTIREWLYTWTGDDLTRVDRPDGTALEYFYAPAPAPPGYLSRIDLVGTDDSRRVLQGYQYDLEGNVTITWKGDTDPAGPDAVEVWSFAYDSDTQTTVTDPLGQQIVYTYDRDPDSSKIRVRQIEGDCPACGLGPNTRLTYGDAANPLLPTREVDGNGNVTDMAYDANGRMTSRTEAVGTAEERTTTWTYDPTYAALVTEISRPSVQSGAQRRTLLFRDAQGNINPREIRGYEDGLPFDCTVAGAPCYETDYTYNAAGMAETVDPPGYGTTDVTTYTYDPARGDLVMDSRIDPLIGTTTYGHDPFNRRTTVTDPNGVTTETVYDELDRVTRVIHHGATPAEDLVTVHEHTVFGDLFRTILPEGNVIEYDHDPAGRLISIERKPDIATPGERTVYGLDAAGNRTSEQLQRWDPGTASWITESSTAYLFTTRCHLDQVLHPDGSITEYAFDCNGNLERTWDANHPSAGKTAEPTATYAYDGLDRTISITRPWAGAGGGQSVTTYSFDVQDHLVAVQDAEGNVTTYKYSDRDLMTEEVSPVSGTTTHLYNPHGELVQTTDARGITELRTVDALGRVTFVDYPDDTLDTTYTYDDPAVLFSLGRLTGITRNGHSVDYAHDRFGRTIQDGDLTFTFDKNGNRTGIGYPGGVSATYDHDFADRETSLSVTTASGTTPVVTSAAYLPSGPLTALAFGTGAVETRTFTPRYFPATIALDAAQDRTWSYTTDAVGNILRIEEAPACPGDLLLSNATVTGTELHQSCAGIEAGPSYTVDATGDLTLQAATTVVLKDGFSVASGGKLAVGTDPSLDGAVVREYDYQDVDYFLTDATGPWGSLAWSYDRIGNRLTETDNGLTDGYAYEPNALGGNTAKLTSISLGVGGTRTFGYTPAGHQTQVNSAGNVVDFTFDDAGRMSEAASANGTADFLYDGRSYLRQAGDLATVGSTTPIYDSAGLLRSLLKQPADLSDPTRYVILYLAGRPVGQVAIEMSQPERWQYVTSDHLGTPLVITDTAQADLWLNRFAPFGEDPLAGTMSGALANEVFLRFPGQWEEEVWRAAVQGAETYYNVYRWYQPSNGRYSRADPVGLNGGINLTAYAQGRPVGLIDPLGLAAWTCRGTGVEAGLIVAGFAQWGTCESECVGGYRWAVDYSWRRIGFGFGLKVNLPVSASLFTIEDGGWALPHPDNFRYAPDELCSTGFSITLGIGVGSSSTEFGRPTMGGVGSSDEPGFDESAEGGFGGSIFTGCGDFSVKNPRRLCCTASSGPPSVGPPPSNYRSPPVMGPRR